MRARGRDGPGDLVGRRHGLTLEDDVGELGDVHVPDGVVQQPRRSTRTLSSCLRTRRGHSLSAPCDAKGGGKGRAHGVDEGEPLVGGEDALGLVVLFEAVVVHVLLEDHVSAPVAARVVGGGSAGLGFAFLER